MRATKINQLNKALVKINDINLEIDNARYNGASQRVIDKLQAREDKACIKSFAICQTMTEEEFDETEFINDMCMDFETANEQLLF